MIKILKNGSRKRVFWLFCQAYDIILKNMPKEETRNIVLNTSAQLVGKAISTILGLGALAIMTRALRVEEYGWYSTAIGFLQFIGIFTDFGFTVVSTKMLSEPAFDKQELLNNLFTWRLLTALLFQGILPFTIIFFPYPIEIKIAVLIMAISFIGVSLNQIFISRLQTKMQLYWQAIAEVIGRIVLVIGIAFAAQGNYGFMPMMVVITLSSIVYSIVLWIKSGQYHLSINKKISQAIYQKMWPTTLSVLFNCIYLQGDRFLLPLYVSQTDMGYYTASYRVLDILVQIIAMLIGIMLPLLSYSWSRNLKDEFKKHFQRALDLISLILMPMIFGVFTLATPIMVFIASEKYEPSGKILSLLIWAIAATTFGMVFGHINLAIDKQKKSLWAYIIAAILGLSGYLILIPKFGIWGAVYTTIFSETVAALILASLAIYYSKTIPKTTALLKIIISSSIMSLAIYWTRNFPLIFNIIWGASIYGITIFSLKTISPETLKEIFKRPTIKNKILNE